MFTGIVERTGRVTSISQTTSSVCTLIVDPGTDFHRDHGDSIAVNGVCLSEIGNGGVGPLTFHVSPETLNKTSLSSIKPDGLVNLERAMRASDRLGGHIVTGHVDTRAEIVLIKPQQGFHELQIKIPLDFAKYVVAKGSIAIDGISLTINNVTDQNDGCILSFMIIPVTWQTTRLSQCREQDVVNIETDIVAKHLERLTQAWATRR
jgi:riboflavin synthase